MVPSAEGEPHPTFMSLPHALDATCHPPLPHADGLYFYTFYPNVLPCHDQEYGDQGPDNITAAAN